jgi:nicotinamidase-related amidase
MIKKRVSAFCGTDLEVVLRGLRTETVVLAGLSTSGAILSTMKEAVDRDFEVVVLRDLCFDPDEEVHRVIMDKVFARHAEVTESEEWLKGLAA